MYTYEYDAAGNILRKNTYALTASWDEPSELVASDIYGYGNADWGGQLTSYNGDTIRYDAIGNPLRYSNGNRWSFTWEHGRRLAQAEGNGYPLSFTYNDEVIRTSKTVNGVVHTYRLNGSQIVAEEWTATDDYGTTAEHMILFLYDAEGAPIGMQYRNQTYAPEIFDVYWFEKNLQGDVMYMVDGTGATVASYAYDPFGNIISATGTMAEINPLRYRGYYYDAELEMYYLQSRYYDPMVGRFINADVYISSGKGILGDNLFTYCLNNPVNMLNVDGREPISIAMAVGYFLIFAFTAGAVLSIVSSPGFQRTWNQMCEAVAYDITCALDALAGVAYNTAVSFSKQARQICDEIYLKLSKLKEVPQYKSQYEVHHIVAKKAINAWRARQILNKVGIDINSRANLVSLKTWLHRRIHTNLYYGWANSVVISATNLRVETRLNK